MPTDTIVTITIDRENALKIVDDIMASFPECSQTLQVQNWDYKRRLFSVFDDDEGKLHKISEIDLLKGFKLMFDPGKWPKGLAFPPACSTYDKKDPSNAWDRWLCKADATDFDAFLQLAVLGEVVYG